jgi:hypothetical protein
MTDNLPLPPFGRILLAYQEQRVRLNFNVYIYVGKKAKDHAHQEIRDGLIATFLPYGESATAYRWPVREQKLIIIDTGGLSYMSAMNACLTIMNYQPRLIYFYSDEHRNEMFLPKGRSCNE